MCKHVVDFLIFFHLEKAKNYNWSSSKYSALINMFSAWKADIDFLYWQCGSQTRLNHHKFEPLHQLERMNILHYNLFVVTCSAEYNFVNVRQDVSEKVSTCSEDKQRSSHSVATYQLIWTHWLSDTTPGLNPRTPHWEQRVWCFAHTSN